MKPLSLLITLLLLVAALAACSPPTPAPPPVVTVVYPTPVAPTQPPPPPTTAPPPAPTIDPRPQPTPVPQRITFPPGGVTASVSGKLAANTSDRWVLRVLAGQTMSVNLVPANGKAHLIIWGAEGTVLISDHADAMQWNGHIPITQDYIISVNSYDGTAPSYTLQITVPPLAPPTAPAPVAKRITFAPGAISATVNGVTHAVDVDRWIIAAQAGQTMSANLIVPPGGRAALVIYGADGTVLISDHASAMQWSGHLPKTQDYHIDVKPETGAVSYTLQVTIPPR
ncbi:MAG: hypothetical protein L0Y55_00040 [Anaerolineales bacterium]|nr:hypothetical protein [Anaerolineales bacterium]